MNTKIDFENYYSISIVEGAIENNNALDKIDLKNILDLLIEYKEVKELLRWFKESHNQESEDTDKILAEIYNRTLIEPYPFGKLK